MLATYFEQMKAAAERHGGVVEKFIGDAVMAVFGVPAVHEDDALRALRAALEMRERDRRARDEGRIGVESGEVVVGTASGSSPAAPVTSARGSSRPRSRARSSSAKATMQLAGDGVDAEPIEPLELKGKREPVPAWRLLSVSRRSARTAFDSPFVGRERELGAARRGVGARLQRGALRAGDGRRRGGRRQVAARERAPAADRRARRARPLPLLRGGDHVLARGRGARRSSAAAWPTSKPRSRHRSRALLETTVTSSTDELAWAFRKFVEAVARERPLVLVFDDIQWAEEALLDLIEHVAFVSSGAPILLVCMARPELLDRRPGWRGHAQPRAAHAEEAEAADPRPARRRAGRRVPSASSRPPSGNPLFVQEMAAMLRGVERRVVACRRRSRRCSRRASTSSTPDERTVLEARRGRGRGLPPRRRARRSHPTSRA